MAVIFPHPSSVSDEGPVCDTENLYKLPQMKQLMKAAKKDLESKAWILYIVRCSLLVYST